MDIFTLFLKNYNCILYPIIFCAQRYSRLMSSWHGQSVRTSSAVSHFYLFAQLPPPASTTTIASHRIPSSQPHLTNLPMGGGTRHPENLNSTAYFNLHALGTAPSPLDRTQGGVFSTTANYLFHYDSCSCPTNTAVFELNNPHF